MAALYFMAGSGLGLWMGITQHFEFAPAHAHINLLGWVSMAVIGALFRLFPAAESSRLAPIQFWVYQIGFPIFMGGLISFIAGYPMGETIVIAGSNVTILGVLLTGIVILLSVRKADDASAERQRKAG